MQYKLSESTPNQAEFAATKWRLQVLEQPWRLGESVGKAAAELWLFGNHSWESLSEAFRLALKYYCRSQGREIDDFEGLKDIASNNFAAILTWLGYRERQIKNRNLAVGLFVLHLWADVILCFERETMEDNEWQYLGRSCMKLRDYVMAIEAFKKMDLTKDTEYNVLLRMAYVSIGDGDEAFKAFRLSGPIPRRSLHMAEMCSCSTDEQLKIEQCENAVRENPYDWVAWQLLTEALFKPAEVVKAYERAVKSNPGQEWALMGLQNAESEMDAGKTNSIYSPSLYEQVIVQDMKLHLWEFSDQDEQNMRTTKAVGLSYSTN